MASKTIYKITVTNWARHNPKHKSSFKKIMISNNFVTDAKIRSLSMTLRWVFINLLVICGDHGRDTVEISQNMLRDMLECRLNIDSVLHTLQSLQLVSYEKIDPLRIELNRNELKEAKSDSPTRGREKKPKPKTASLQPSVEPIVKLLMARYCERWKARYGVNPVFQKHNPRQLKDVGEQNGLGKTLDLLDAYFKCPNERFLKQRHDVQTFVSNLAVITAFLSSGKTISNNELRQMDNAVSAMNTLDAIRNGEI